MTPCFKCVFTEDRESPLCQIRRPAPHKLPHILGSGRKILETLYPNSGRRGNIIDSSLYVNSDNNITYCCHISPITTSVSPTTTCVNVITTLVSPATTFLLFLFELSEFLWLGEEDFVWFVEDKMFSWVFKVLNRLDDVFQEEAAKIRKCELDIQSSLSQDFYIPYSGNM